MNSSFPKWKTGGSVGAVVVKEDASDDLNLDGSSNGNEGVAEAEAHLQDVRERHESFQRHLEETRNKTWVKLAIERVKVLIPLLLIFIATLLIVSTVLKDQAIIAFEWMQDNKPESVFIFIGFMAIWLICFLSKSILSIGAGFIFGFPIGLAAAVTGMMLGLFGTMVVVWTLFTWCGWRRKLREYMVNNYLEIRVLHHLMETEPFRAILLVKMSILPTWLKSYSLVILDAPWKTHLFVQFISGGIYSILFVYLGASAANIIEAIESGKGVSVETILINGFGILMTLVVIWYLGYKVKKMIKKYEEQMDVELAEEEEEALEEVEEALEHRKSVQMNP